MSSRATNAGFTISELTISLAIISIVVLGSYALLSAGVDNYNLGMSKANLERKASQVLELIANEVALCGKDVIYPDPQSPYASSVITLQRNGGWSDGTLQWGPTTRLAFRHAKDDPDDGKDNNRDGLVDEGEIVRVQDPGGENERLVVLVTGVPEFLGGEIENGKDDNGNGLIDEPGLSFDRAGNVWTIRLTLESHDADGTVVTHTAETSVRVRN